MHRRLFLDRQFNRCLLDFFTWLGTAQTKCTDGLASAYPMPPGLTGALSLVKPVLLSLRPFVQFVVAIFTVLFHRYGGLDLASRR